jgi:hypothetical protein
VGTGVGYIYVISANGTMATKCSNNLKGELAQGEFPIMMDALFSQVIAEDLNADGKLGKN